MQTLFFILFGYLVYQFLIKPMLLGLRGPTKGRTPQQDMMEMMRRMQQFQQQEYQQPPTQQKNRPKAQDEGEYIDYEEID